ncbi:MAG: M4 family metallopeptidase [Anaerolineae bacterium]
MQRHSISRLLTLFLVISVLLSLASTALAAPAAAPQPAASQAPAAAPFSAPLSSGPESVASAVQRLNADAQGAVSVSYRNATGAVSFVRVGPGGNLYPAGAGELAEAQALGFLADYGALFGIADAGVQLISAGSWMDAAGNTRLAYTQVHQGVPVFGSYLHVVVSAGGALTSANAATVPGIKVSTIPALSPEKASAAALQAVSGPERGALASSDVRVLSQRLLVFRAGLVQDTPNGADHLVYEVEVGNGSSVRQFIYVDAHSGAVVDRIDGIQDGQEAPEALNRQISESSLANVVWTNPPDPEPIPGGWAGGTAQQVIDWNNEAAGTKESYNIFGSAAGWDSFNNAGATMRVVNNDPTISCPNANWNGTSTNYCTGVTADDVVAHEWGHAYTEFTSGLIYQWQSGAMNEAYSDIWGETVDLLNGRGTDTPGGPRQSDGAACSIYGAGAPSTDATYKWLMGEDATAFSGAIRDMWRPECYGDPGRVTSPSYYCSTGDNGGVHSNSGGAQPHLLAAGGWRRLQRPDRHRHRPDQGCAHLLAGAVGLPGPSQQLRRSGRCAGAVLHRPDRRQSEWPEHQQSGAGSLGRDDQRGRLSGSGRCRDGHRAAHAADPMQLPAAAGSQRAGAVRGPGHRRCRADRQRGLGGRLPAGRLVRGHLQRC